MNFLAAAAVQFLKISELRWFGTKQQSPLGFRALGNNPHCGATGGAVAGVAFAGVVLAGVVVSFWPETYESIYRKSLEAEYFLRFTSIPAEQTRNRINRLNIFSKTEASAV